MKDIGHLSSLLEHMMVESRIRDLAHYALGDRLDRVAHIASTISQLPTGWYLIGTGPQFCDIIRVGRQEITIGRTASAGEEPLEVVIDYAVNDAMLTGPREVSRLHLAVRVNGRDDVLEVRDERSSTGTWLVPENEQLEPGVWHELDSGRSIGLGPSQVNLFVAVRVGHPGCA